MSENATTPPTEIKEATLIGDPISDLPEVTLAGDPISDIAAGLLTQDLEPGRDKVRAVLAVGLLALFSLIVVLGFALVFFPPKSLASTDQDLQARTVYLQAMLGTVAGVFGAATGFYFGASKPNKE